jgi:MGT family glycosyltransferase
MLSEAGHLYATVALAEKLRARGHEVSYLATPDFENRVRSRGFEFVPVLSHLFPEGFANQRPPASATSNRQGFLTILRRQGQLVKDLRDFWSGEEINRLLAGLRPDLLLADSMLPYAALAAYRHGIPTLMVSVTLPQIRDERVPPLTTTLLPGAAPWDRLKIRLAWDRFFLVARLYKRFASLCGVDIDLGRWVRELAEASNYPLDNVNTRTMFAPALSLPELILCPREFDFPRAESPNRYYIEPLLDLAGDNVSFPWNRICGEQPLLFCTLGSQSHHSPFSRRLFQTIMDALATRPERQLVVALGEHLNVADFRVSSPNITAVNWAPHAELVKRASIVINHGGLGTVKQCIYFGVPMIVFPSIRDQPGNAARVKYHGLGLVARPRGVSVGQILALVDTVESDPAFKAKAESMARVFREAEESAPGVRVVEQLLR